MSYTVKPLGKLYTLIYVVNNIILWLRKETQKDLDPDFVKVLVNLSVLDVAEILSGAGSSDYSKDVNITDQAASFTTTIKQSATYTNSTRNVFLTTHGLTASDIGKRIAIWIGTTRAGIAEIESITDADNFVITKALGGDGTANYAVLSFHSSPTVDLSTYNIAQVTKILDSVNGEVVEKPDKVFDNIYRFPTWQNKVFYNVRGQYLHLKQGTEVAAIGDLTMSYNSYPQKTEEDADQLDIRDMYLPLVTLKAKNYCIEHLGLVPPESLTNAIDQKSREVRENIQKEKELANIKSQGK